MGSSCKLEVVMGRHGLGSNKKAPTSGHHEESDWVLVKKQKVTILIPPLPLINHLSPIPNPTLLTHSPSPPPINTLHSVSDGDKLPFKLPSSPPIPNLKTRDGWRHRIRSADTFGCPGARIASNFRSKMYRRRSFLDGNVLLLNPSLRALNLERKLQRAGGLSSWLASLGLHQFVNIFKNASVGKFQLVNLTMKKLKDMGANAVGPRRKLMHAIDCLCQPYCFQTLQTRRKWKSSIGV